MNKQLYRLYYDIPGGNSTGFYVATELLSCLQHAKNILENKRDYPNVINIEIRRHDLILKNEKFKWNNPGSYYLNTNGFYNDLGAKVQIHDELDQSFVDSLNGKPNKFEDWLVTFEAKLKFDGGMEEKQIKDLAESYIDDVNETHELFHLKVQSIKPVK